MSSIRPFEVKSTKPICIRESDLYKAIKSLSFLFFYRLDFEKGAKDSKITKSKGQKIKDTYHYSFPPTAPTQERLLTGVIDQNTYPTLSYNRALIVIRNYRYITIVEIFSLQFIL